MKILSVLEQNLLFLLLGKLYVFGTLNQGGEKTEQSHFRKTKGTRYVNPKSEEKEK